MTTTTTKPKTAKSVPRNPSAAANDEGSVCSDVVLVTGKFQPDFTAAAAAAATPGRLTTALMLCDDNYDRVVWHVRLRQTPHSPGPSTEFTHSWAKVCSAQGAGGKPQTRTETVCVQHTRNLLFSPVLHTLCTLGRTWIHTSFTFLLLLLLPPLLCELIFSRPLDTDRRVHTLTTIFSLYYFFQLSAHFFMIFV